MQGVLGQWFLSRFDYYVLDLRRTASSSEKQERTGTRAPFTFINARAVVATSLGNLVLDSGATRLILFGVQSRGGDTGTIKTFTGSQAVGTASRKLVSPRPGYLAWRRSDDGQPNQSPASKASSPAHLIQIDLRLQLGKLTSSWR